MEELLRRIRKAVKESEQTPEQKEIERVVTNGRGFRSEALIKLEELIRKCGRLNIKEISTFVLKKRLADMEKDVSGDQIIKELDGVEVLTFPHDEMLNLDIKRLFCEMGKVEEAMGYNPFAIITYRNPLAGYTPESRTKDILSLVMGKDNPSEIPKVMEALGFKLITNYSRLGDLEQIGRIFREWKKKGYETVSIPAVVEGKILPNGLALYTRKSA